jgi:hypothetical protein
MKVILVYDFGDFGNNLPSFKYIKEQVERKVDDSLRLEDRKDEESDEPEPESEWSQDVDIHVCKELSLIYTKAGGRLNITFDTSHLDVMRGVVGMFKEKSDKPDAKPELDIQTLRKKAETALSNCYNHGNSVAYLFVREDVLEAMMEFAKSILK